MHATFLIISCLLVPGQPPERSDWLLTPRLNRAQELLYRGEYQEEILGTTQFSRKCRLETRVLVLNTAEKEMELAALTLMRSKEDPDQRKDAPPLSTRLEPARFDLQGKWISANTVDLLPPLDSPPTTEWGFVLEVPREPVHVGKRWPVSEEGRPVRIWEVVGTESVGGISCVKLLGTQQSPDWEQLRADRTAWQRTDTVWIAPRQGIVQQLERVTTRREPGQSAPTHRHSLRYQLDTNFQYSADLFVHRQLEISQARTFWENALPLLANPARYGAQLESLLGRINYHLQRNSETPYREAILRVKRRIEAGQKGEALVAVEDTSPKTTVATVGKPAPDFVAPDVVNQQSGQLKRWSGKPMVLLFYKPDSKHTEDLLTFAHRLAKHYPKSAVIGMAMSDDVDKIRKQLTDLGVSIPILSGNGLYQTYAVEATPKAVVIDSLGFVKESYLGWGLDVQASLIGDLKKYLPPEQP